MTRPDGPIKTFLARVNKFLSNFYEAEVTYGGLTYGSSEAAYQAQKCMNDEDRQAFTGYDPLTSKREGKKAAIRPDWEDVRLGIMEEIVRAKFTQHPELAALLLETGDREIQEGNRWHDKFWGIDIFTGEGENHLGKILMKIREELRGNEGT